jgi:hypothetical protein
VQRIALLICETARRPHATGGCRFRSSAPCSLLAMPASFPSHTATGGPCHRRCSSQHIRFNIDNRCFGGQTVTGLE